MRTNNRLLVSAAVALALGLPLTAVAADSGFYLGALVGYSNADLSQSEWDNAALNAFSSYGGTLTSTSLDKSGTAFGATVGYQFFRNFAVEASYIDLGKATGTASGTVPVEGTPVALSVNADFKSHGPALAVVGILPFGQGWAVDVRVGVYYGDTEITGTASAAGQSGSASQSESASSLMAGVGGSYAFDPHWSVRLDYLYFNGVGDKHKTGQADVNVASLGLRYQF